MFCGTGWSRSIETAYEDEGGRILEAAPLAVSTGVVDQLERRENVRVSLWGS